MLQTQSSHQIHYTLRLRQVTRDTLSQDPDNKTPKKRNPESSRISNKEPDIFKESPKEQHIPDLNITRCYKMLRDTHKH